MDLRTFSERVKETGRAMSTSALSKTENGDRRVDVDDLSVFAYILQTTPAALLAPPEGASPPTGVPSGQFNHEEIQAWVRGQANFTAEDLARYWKDEYFSAVSSIHYYENLMTAVHRGRQGQPDAPRDLRGALGLTSAHVAMLLAPGSSRSTPMPCLPLVTTPPTGGPDMPGKPGRRSRSRHAGSITSYATQSGQRWKFQIYVPKDPERPELGDTRITRGGFKSLDEAQRVLAEALRKKKSNGRFQVKIPTIGEYAEHWIAGLRLQNSTIQGYQKIIRNHLTPYLGAIRARQAHRHQDRGPLPDSSRPPAAATSPATASRCRRTPSPRSTSCSPPCSTPPSTTG